MSYQASALNMASSGKRAKGLKPPCFSAAYTILELMIIIAIVGILVSVAIPGFQDSIRRNARDSIMQDLSTSLGLARSTAVTQGTRASICRSTNQTTCAATEGADWAQGWLVFSDTGTAGTIDGSDAILQIHPALNGQVAIEMADGDGNDVTGEFLQFNSDGFLANSNSGAYFKFCDPDNVAANSRALWISNTGRSSLSVVDNDGVHNDLGGTNLVCP